MFKKVLQFAAITTIISTLIFTYLVTIICLIQWQTPFDFYYQIGSEIKAFILCCFVIGIIATSTSWEG